MNWTTEKPKILNHNYIRKYDTLYVKVINIQIHRKEK
jgi:hypothetical protein